jgi:hypothetical protein
MIGYRELHAKILDLASGLNVLSRERSSVTVVAAAL